MAVAVLLSGIAYVILLRDFNAGISALTSMGLFFLPVLFTLWSVVGLFIRARSRNFRMFTNMAISSVVIAVITQYFAANAQHTNSDGLTLWYFLVLSLWVACLTGSLVTYLYLVRD